MRKAYQMIYLAFKEYSALIFSSPDWAVWRSKDLNASENGV